MMTDTAPVGAGAAAVDSGQNMPEGHPADQVQSEPLSIVSNSAPTQTSLTQSPQQGSGRPNPLLTTTWPPVILALVSCRGNTRKAAESLDIQHELYMLEVTQHVEELQNAIRAIMLIDTFELASKTRKFLAYSLDELKGSDLVKLYGDTLNQLERLTDNRGPASNVQHNTYNIGNTEQKIIQTLDPRVQAALLRARNIDPNNIPDMAQVIDADAD